MSLRKFALFSKKGETPPKSNSILMNITPSDAVYERTLKIWNFEFFARLRVYLLFFFPGVIV